MSLINYQVLPFYLASKVNAITHQDLIGGNHYWKTLHVMAVPFQSEHTLANHFPFSNTAMIENGSNLHIRTNKKNYVFKLSESYAQISGKENVSILICK